MVQVSGGMEEGNGLKEQEGEVKKMDKKNEGTPKVEVTMGRTPSHPNPNLSNSKSLHRDKDKLERPQHCIYRPRALR